MIPQGFCRAKGRAVRGAIDVGDRSIDTAQAYGNGAGAGAAGRKSGAKHGKTRRA